MKRSITTPLGLFLLVAGISVSVTGSFALERRLPPKQPWLRHMEPEVRGITRQNIHYVHNWILALRVANIGGLVGFALLSRDLRIGRKTAAR